MAKQISISELIQKSTETEITPLSEFNGRKGTAKQRLGFEARHKSKRAGLRAPQPGILIEKLSNVVRDIKIITQFTMSISSKRE